MKIRNIYTFCLLFLIFTANSNIYGQNPMSLYFMETIPQVSRINPAIQPRANSFVALPSGSFAFSSDLGFNDIYQKNGSNRYTLIERQFDYNKFHNKLGNAWNIDANTEVNLLGFGFRTQKGYFTFNVSIKADIQNGLPSDIFKITETGLTDNLDFSPLRQKSLVYKQVSIGYSREINDKLTLGVNLRPILGVAALMTDFNKFDINTEREEWGFVLKGDIYSSVPTVTVIERPGDFPDIREDVDNLDNDDYIKYGTSLSNPGFAADFGATYKLTDRITLSAALNNLGFIKWKDDLNSISFDGDFLFEGAEINNPDWDSDSYFDELEEKFKTELDYKVGNKAFSSSLTPSLYVGASYQLTDAISAGFLSRSILQKNGMRQHFSLSANVQPYSFVSFNASLSQNIRGNTYAGMGFSIYLGPLQIYALTDFIPLRYSNYTVIVNEDSFTVDYYPTRAKEITVMAGLNLVFGKKGFQNKPMLNRGAY